MQNNDNFQTSNDLVKVKTLLDALVKTDKSVISSEIIETWQNFQTEIGSISDPSIWIEEVSLRLGDFALPENAATLALVCGGFIEKGVVSNPFFENACTLLERYIAEFEPFLGNEPNEKDDKYTNNPETFEQDLQIWQHVEEKLNSLPEDKKKHLTELATIINRLVLPIMACLIHHNQYLEIFKSKSEFIDKINQTYYSDLFNIDHLYYLSEMATMSNPDMVILLYTSKKGLVVRGRHIRNGFHALELLQPFLTEHRNVLEIGKINPDVLVEEPVQKTLYSWAPWTDWQSVGGPSTIPFILGEPSIDIWRQWQEKVVLVAMEELHENMYNRSWEDMTHPIHVAQNSELEFIRYLNQNEVDELMQGYKPS